MYNLLIFCDYPWLGWLLPLLGLLLGWLIWGRYKSIVNRLDGDVNRLNFIKSDLEADLKESRSKRSEADGEIALLKGRMRELEASQAQGVTNIAVTGDEEKLQSKIQDLESELNYANSTRSDLEGQIALLRGRINEMEYASKKTSLGISGKGPDDDVTSLKDELKYSASKRSELEGQIALLQGKINEMDYTSKKASSGSVSKGPDDDVASLKDELKYSASKRSELEGQIALLQGKVNEMEYTSKKASSGSVGKGPDDDIASIKEELKYSASKRSELEGQIALLQGKISEMDAKAVKLGIGNLSDMSSGEQKSKEKPSSFVSGKYGALQDDNLQIIEGIGPKMESVLKENGVHTWKDLANQSDDDLQDVLSKYGVKYRIIDSSTWNDQAQLASTNNWDQLITYQKTLDTGRSKGGSTTTDAKVEKIMVKLGLIKKWKENDLKAIEGIGPKIEQLLKKAGIHTWQELANTSVARIKEILEAAGSRYRLADPGTWPKQANMAASGNWDELGKYQDLLKGGR